MTREFQRRDVLKAMAAVSLLGIGADDPKGLPEQIVDTMNEIFGRHPGFRAFHAKGVVCEGDFTPSAAATTLSKAPHLRGPVKTTVRFSDGTGLPDVPDGFPDAGPRGMAVRFHLSEGGVTDIVTNAFNGFPVSDGEEFLAFFRAIAATKPGSPKPTPLDKFLGDHPKALKVVTAPKPVPASFVTEPYFAVHAFRFTNAEGKSRFGRYQFLPVAETKFLAAEEAAKKGPSFLIDELTERLAKGPAALRLVVQLAADGDVTDDATVVWPEDRPVVELGVLSITGRVADQDAAQRRLGVDPLRLVDGIEASDDPLLELRSGVYAVSRRRRR
ncbi:catalase family peroxidase [Singulisphaera sp. Ch08]|uniref:Catalase-related peroxidase n=1 Tax=Singulisphaera sp. Ch08 TaxID=3120278 RepID=A0AAU7CBD2_9BACT